MDSANVFVTQVSSGPGEASTIPSNMPICEACGSQVPDDCMLMHSMHCTHVVICGSAVVGEAPPSYASDMPASVTSTLEFAMEAACLDPLSAPMAHIPLPPPPPRAPEPAPSPPPLKPGTPPKTPRKLCSSSSSERLACHVSSDAEELQLLHEVYGWVPGRGNVRPTPAVRAQKELLLSNLGSMWVSSIDWVFHHVFGSPTTREKGKRRAERPQAGRTVFKPNPYPYDVPDETIHWVFWMASPAAEWPEARITAGIKEAIAALGGGDFGAQAAPIGFTPHQPTSTRASPSLPTPTRASPRQPAPTRANPRQPAPTWRSPCSMVCQPEDEPARPEHVPRSSLLAARLGASYTAYYTQYYVRL